MLIFASWGAFRFSGVTAKYQNNAYKNVGTYQASDTFSYDTVNYNEIIFEQTTLNLEIEKASVATPTVVFKEYTGGTIVADITNTEHYTVEQNNGGINTGAYNVVLCLFDFSILLVR